MTQSIRAGFIVEGHGDVKAVPVVFRRIVSLRFPDLKVITQDPFRVPRDKLKKAGELERTVDFVARGLENRRTILVLIDSDDDCPGQLGPSFLDRARRARGDLPIGVAIANREFENWFIAAATSLAGKRTLPLDLTSPASPETIRGAKEWISKMMIGRPYKETTDQEPLARAFDLEQARACPSFDKLCRETIRIVSEAIG